VAALGDKHSDSIWRVDLILSQHGLQGFYPVLPFFVAVQ
jgi:hypothetical protein